MSHREAYPEQYSHPLVDKTVRVVTHSGEQGVGKVIRVFGTRFGQLAEVEGVGEPGTAWRTRDCTPK
jgi:hypothetical protein